MAMLVVKSIYIQINSQVINGSINYSFLTKRALRHQVLATIGETLEPLDDDGVIPVYGFGDASPDNRKLFPLSPGVRMRTRDIHFAKTCIYVLSYLSIYTICL